MTPRDFAVFSLDDLRIAVARSFVERFVRAVEVTPLPGAPYIVLGAIDVAGAIVPVISLRRRFGIPDRDVDVTDQFLIARASTRTVAIVIDAAEGVIALTPDTISSAAQVVAGLAHVQGVARLDDGLVLIHDLDSCLSLDEQGAVDEALRAAEAGRA